MQFVDGMKEAKRPSGPILGFIITLAGYLLAGIVPTLFGINGENSSTFSGQLVMTCSFIAWIIVIFVWVKFREQRAIASIGFRSGAVSQTLLGTVLGLLMTSSVVAISVLTGQASLGAVNTAALASTFALLFGFAIQASAEEIAYRGYFAQALVNKWGITVMVIVQAVVFTLGHLGNGLNPVAIVTMIAVSYFLMMWVLATNSLWGAMAFHTFWNWSQANLWGASVSNIKMDTHVFEFIPAAGSDLLTGGSFGLEGSLITIAFLVIGGIIFQMRWRAKRRTA